MDVGFKKAQRKIFSLESSEVNQILMRLTKASIHFLRKYGALIYSSKLIFFRYSKLHYLR